jgi:hypothetical protein
MFLPLANPTHNGNLTLGTKETSTPFISFLDNVPLATFPDPPSNLFDAQSLSSEKLLNF